MGLKMVCAASAILLGATTFAFAQSLPNYGPNAPANSDSFGKPYSGAKPLQPGYKAYAYQRRVHHTHKVTHPRPNE
jgi:hypothetical protein